MGNRFSSFFPSSRGKLLLQCHQMTTPCLRLALCFFACLLLCGLSVPHAHAASGLDMKVAMKKDVLTCTATLTQVPMGMRQALKEGTEISVEWKVNVAIERKYWLNNTVASVLVNRHVVPDLVSRTWTLEDMASGITRRAFSLDEAVRFLTRLNDFPVVDRSLLTPGQIYVVAVTVSEWEGNKQGNIWTSWFGPKSGSATSEFRMP